MSSDPPRLTPLRAWPWLLAGGLALFLALVWRFDFVCDDAYISFRYSKNLAEGAGLRFNPGSGPPVEGYSNFLWVLYLALFEVLGVDVGAAARASGTLCGVALLVIFTRALARRTEGEPAGLAGLAAGLGFLASMPSLAMWSTGGLATAPFTLCLFAGALLLAGEVERPRAVAAGLCLLAAALFRADGAAFCVLVLLVGGLFGMRNGRKELVRAALVAGGILVVGVAAHVLWRLSYYGDYLPNTARIKAGFSGDRLGRGLDYVLVYVMTLPAVLVASAVGFLPALKRGGALGWIALAVVLANLGYAVYVGGDFMAMGRFLVGMLPFLAWLLALGTCRGVRLGWALAAVCLALNLLPAFGRYPTPRSLRAQHHFRFNNPEYWDELRMWRSMRRNARTWVRDGKALARLTEAGESMVLGPIGAVGYYTDLHLYDLYGLTSREVAEADVPPRKASPGHDHSVRPDFFLPRRPTYLGYWVVRAGGPRTPERLPGFLRAYADHFDIEAHPAPTDLGYPAGREIWLMRMRY